ncbi:MAG TPA: hypothetical protein VII69_04235 [Candidatus Eremiobacteraceae bacterium]
MIKAICLSALFFLTAMTLAIDASADAGAVKAQQVKFVKDYLSAMQTKNRAAAMKLLHPTLRACVTSRTRPFFDYLVTQQMDGFPSGSYSNLDIGPVKPKSEPSLWNYVPAKSFPYPVMPTYDIEIGFGNDTATLFSDLLEVAPSGASWYWVTACPNTAGMQFMRAMQAQAAAQKANARKLAALVHEPLLSQIKKLIAAHDKFGAAQAYQKAKGGDLATAAAVVDAIESP